MTATTDEVDLHPCACGCGELVKGKWARGHWARGEAQKRNLHPLPGPDDELEDDDGEDLPDDLVAELEQLDWLDAQEPPRREPLERAEPIDDPPAGRIPPPRSSGASPRGRKTTRVTATMQRDVQAKIRMVLMPAGKLWQVRDPMCGGTFVQQEPDISEALAEIVCDSPDLLNWFTGPAGGYMKYFKLVMAVQPVLLMVWMHHIAHADRPPQVDATQPVQNYAA